MSPTFRFQKISLHQLLFASATLIVAACSQSNKNSRTSSLSSSSNQTGKTEVQANDTKRPIDQEEGMEGYLTSTLVSQILLENSAVNGPKGLVQADGGYGADKVAVRVSLVASSSIPATTESESITLSDAKTLASGFAAADGSFNLTLNSDEAKAGFVFLEVGLSAVTNKLLVPEKVAAKPNQVYRKPGIDGVFVLSSAGVVTASPSTGGSKMYKAWLVTLNEASRSLVSLDSQCIRYAPAGLQEIRAIVATQTQSPEERIALPENIFVTSPSGTPLAYSSEQFWMHSTPLLHPINEDGDGKSQSFSSFKIALGKKGKVCVAWGGYSTTVELAKAYSLNGWDSGKEVNCSETDSVYCIGRVP